MTGDDPDRLIKALLRGIAHDRSPQVRDAWSGLAALGPDAAPAVQAKIDSSDWTTCTNQVHRDYLAILLGLLHELDEDVCRHTLARLRGSRLHPSHARTIEITERLSADAPVEAIYRGIRIAASRIIPNPADAIALVIRWLGKLPEKDLVGILRIDIVPTDPGLDYLGKYRPRFAGIVLVWREKNGTRFLRAWRRLLKQRTLYHEVGHHALGHINGGQDPEQEAQANDYARRHLRRARPVVTSTLRLIFLPLFLLGSLCRLLAVILDRDRQSTEGRGEAP